MEYDPTQYKSVSLPNFLKESIVTRYRLSRAPMNLADKVEYSPGLLDAFRETFKTSKFFEINDPIFKAATTLLFHPLEDVNQHCVLKGNDRWGITADNAIIKNCVTFEFALHPTARHTDVFTTTLEGIPLSWAEEFGWPYGPRKDGVDYHQDALGTALFGNTPPKIVPVYGLGHRTFRLTEAAAPEAFATLAKLREVCQASRAEHDRKTMALSRWLTTKNTTKQVLDERPDLLSCFTDTLLMRMSK